MSPFLILNKDSVFSWSRRFPAPPQPLTPLVRPARKRAEWRLPTWRA